MTPASPLWYLTRGAGMVTLVFLTLSFLLGVLTTGRYNPPTLPRFINSGLHRNVALGALLFGGLHVVTAILDPFAKLRLLDAAVPFLSAYRPLWLGLGVLSGELFLVLVVTSLVRQWIGHRLWRAIHWATYAAWPMAILHGVGTGSDEKAPWAFLIYVACLGTVVLAIAWRLLGGEPGSRGTRIAGGWALSIAVLAFGAWVLTGPLQPGWAQAAGTPTALLQRGTPRVSPATAVPQQSKLPTGLDHTLAGRAVSTGSGVEVDFLDQSDPAYEVRFFPGNGDSAPSRLQVSNGGIVICDVEASNGENSVTGVCAGTRVTLNILRATRRGDVTAELVTG